MDQILIKKMKLEISANYQVQEVLLAISHARYRVRLGFLIEIDHKELFARSLWPYMYLFFVVTHKCLSIRIVEDIFHANSTMFSVHSCELEPEFHS